MFFDLPNKNLKSKHIYHILISAYSLFLNKFAQHTHLTSTHYLKKQKNTAFDTVLIDTIRPLPRTKIKIENAITIIYDLSKYLRIRPVEDKKQKLEQYLNLLY